MVEVVNMLPPPHMLPQKAPKPVAPLRCAVTGRPAKYRDPASGYGYADLEAYRELKQHMQSEQRGLTGKRTKRQSSGKLPSMHQQDTESNTAQLATGAAQDHAAAAPEAQASKSAHLLHKQVQSAADTAADSLSTGVASGAAVAHIAAAPETAVSPHQAAAVEPAAVDARQSQAAATGVQLPAASGAAETSATAVTAAAPGSEPDAQQSAQQANQQSAAAANAAPPGPSVNVDSEVADKVSANMTVTCMPLHSAISDPMAGPAGRHCCICPIYSLRQ